MKKYKHVFFDLDQTLWDFDRCSSETLSELYNEHGLMEKLNCDCNVVVEKFTAINESLWGEFSSGKISKEELRHKRFRKVFNDLGTLSDDFIDYFGEQYLIRCPKKGHLMPFTEEVLKYLFEKYNLHIITNGFSEVQQQKLLHAGISSYFKEIITSDGTGFKKPDKEIFSYALNRVGCTSGNCIMIGDNLEADILGASNSNIDHVFYNPKKIRYYMAVNHEIHSLKDLYQIL